MSSDIPRAPARLRAHWPRNITQADLDNPQRVNGLWLIATANGWIDRGETTQIAFFTLAFFVAGKPKEEVRVSHGAMFTSGVRNKRWFGSNEDESRAKLAIEQFNESRIPRQPAEPEPVDDVEGRKEEYRKQLAAMYGDSLHRSYSPFGKE